jgi:hypothetical protein
MDTFDCLIRAVLDREEGAEYAFHDYVAEHGLFEVLVESYRRCRDAASQAWDVNDGSDAAYEAASQLEKEAHVAWKLYDAFSQVALRHYIPDDTPDF